MQALIESKGIAYALEAAGGQHRYQYRAILIIILQHMFRSFFMMYYPYLNQAPIFLCKDPNNPEAYIDCTENNGGCQDKIISPNSPSSLAIDIGLYCEYSYIKTLAGTLFFLGGNIGAGYFSFLSDWKGRKTSLLHAYVFGSIGLFMLGVGVMGPFTYILFLMLTWACLNSFCTISLTYINEISNEEFSKAATAVILLGITAGEFIIINLAYFITSWRVLFIWCIGVPALIAGLSFRFLEETPVYYYTKRNFQKAAEVLTNIAKFNNITTPLEISDCIQSKKSFSSETELLPKTAKSWNYIKILQHPELRTRVFIFGIVKLYLCMAFFGSIFALSGLGGSIYINSIIAVCAEALGYALSFKARAFPVRKLLIVSLEIVVVTGISFLLIPNVSCEDFFICRASFLNSSLALILRTCICFIYGFAYGLGNDLFPPEVRSQSIGITDVFAALGGMITPLVILVAERNQISPLFLFGVLGFIALSVSKYIPESPSITLEDKPEDIEMTYMKFVDKNTKCEKKSSFELTFFSQAKN